MGSGQTPAERARHFAANCGLIRALRRYTLRMRKFSARETEWLQELDGIELAGFHQRALAFLVDWIFIGLAFSMLVGAIGLGYIAILRLQGKPLPDPHHYTNVLVNPDAKMLGEQTVNVQQEGHESGAEHLVSGIVVPILYFGVLLWKGKGRTPGKRIMKIRVVSISHRHLSFWHSVERALGYGAAALEGGFGFVQFFLHPYRRCAQDRLAETIVVTEDSYQALQHRLSHPLLPDSNLPDGTPAEPADSLAPGANPEGLAL